MAGYIGSRAAVATSGVERKKTFAITTTTTSLTGLDYTPNHVHVFHNGIRLVDGTDYTATNGTSITLVNAAENGDEVVVVSYGTFSPADTYTKTEADDRYVNASGDTMTGDLALPAGGLTVGTDQLSVDASGNVLVGTTSGDVFTNQTRISVNGTNYGGLSLFSGGSRRGQAVGSSAQFEITSSGEIPLLLGTNDTERMRIDSAGRVTMPYQPAFSATGASGGNVSVSNPTALSLQSTHFNRGNHYNTSTSKFTAPVSGIYQFNIVTYLNSDTATVVFLVNDAQIGSADTDNLLFKTTASPYTMAMSICATLAANDTVSVSSRAGSGSTTFYIGHTTFSGYLIG